MSASCGTHFYWVYGFWRLRVCCLDVVVLTIFLMTAKLSAMAI